MNAKSTLKKYIGPSSGLKFLAWVLALATIALFVVGIQQRSIEDDPNEAVRFDPVNSEAGDYVYLDIVGVSNWLYKIESDSSSTIYYTAEDAEDYLYTIILSDSQYNQMLTQRTYWDREYGVSDPNAEVYRLYGTAKKTSTEVKEALTDSWSDSGITSVSMYEYYFGTMHIDGTSLPSDDRGMGYILGAIFALAGWICTVCARSKSKKAMKQSIKRLEALGELDQAAAEMNGAVTVIGKDKCRISENYIFTKRGGAVPVKDILWSYKHITRTNGIKGNTELVANTCNGKTYSLISLAGGDRKGKTEEIMAAILQRNPTVLVGYNNENLVEYRARLKEFKTTGKRPADNLAVDAPADTSAAVGTVAAAAAATAAETVAEVAAEPVVEPAAEPVVEVAAEPVVEAAAEPVVEPAAEPVVEPAAEPVVEVAAEPVVEAAAEPVAEVAAEPVVEVAAEPVVEVAAEPVVEPVAETSEVKADE